jgi:hypothetical protein
MFSLTVILWTLAFFISGQRAKDTIVEEMNIGVAGRRWYVAVSDISRLLAQAVFVARSIVRFIASSSDGETALYLVTQPQPPWCLIVVHPSLMTPGALNE